MNWTQTGILRWIRYAVLSLSVAGLGGFNGASAQSAPNGPGTDATAVRTFHLNRNSSGRGPKDIQYSLTLMLDPTARVSLSEASNAITVRTTPAQMQIAEKVIEQLDRPEKDYRLTYTLSEMDDGKRVGVQHFALILTPGAQTTLKQGSKVPVATGTMSGSPGGSSTQFTYIDVGVNVNATLNEGPDGLRLQSKVEQSAALTDRTVAGVVEPVIRQTVLEGTSLLQPGKPVALGSLDVPGSTRHLDVEVVVELLH